jgi:pimeloyl-ACP methyl ester carboxylesterase
VCTSQAWVFQRRELASPDVRLVFYDQRGHGRSGRPAPDKTDQEILSRDLARVIDAAAPTGPVILVGHSMGGMTVLALVEGRPDLFEPAGRVGAVALLSTSAGKLASSSLGLPAGLAHVTRRLLPRSYSALVRYGDRIENHRPRGEFAWMLSKHLAFGGDVSPALVGLMEAMIAQAPLAMLAGFGAGLLGYDKRAALARLTDLPTLIMVGGADLLTPVDHSTVMTKALPAAQFVIVPGCGHMIMLEAPDQTNDHLRDLIGRLRAADDRMVR